MPRKIGNGIRSHRRTPKMVSSTSPGRSRRYPTFATPGKEISRARTDKSRTRLVACLNHPSEADSRISVRKHESLRAEILWQVQRTKSLNLVRKKTSVGSGLNTIQQTLSIGRPPKSPAPEFEAVTSHEFPSSARIYDRKLESICQQTGRSLSVAAEGFPRRATGKGTSMHEAGASSSAETASRSAT